MYNTSVTPKSFLGPHPSQSSPLMFPTPPQAPADLPSVILPLICLFQSFIYKKIMYIYIHTCARFCLASCPQCDVFFIHPCCHAYQQFVPLYFESFSVVWKHHSYPFLYHWIKFANILSAFIFTYFVLRERGGA